VFDDERSLLKLQRIVELAVAGEQAQRSGAGLVEPSAAGSAAVGAEGAADGEGDAGIDVERADARTRSAGEAGGVLVREVEEVARIGGDVIRPAEEEDGPGEVGEVGGVCGLDDAAGDGCGSRVGRGSRERQRAAAQLGQRQAPGKESAEITAAVRPADAERDGIEAGAVGDGSVACQRVKSLALVEVE
jgi:hypothetical protein